MQLKILFVIWAFLDKTRAKFYRLVFYLIQVTALGMVRNIAISSGPFACVQIEHGPWDLVNSWVTTTERWRSCGGGGTSNIHLPTHSNIEKYCFVLLILWPDRQGVGRRHLNGSGEAIFHYDFDIKIGKIMVPTSPESIPSRNKHLHCRYIVATAVLSAILDKCGWIEFFVKEKAVVRVRCRSLINQAKRVEPDTVTLSVK
jgi:hypothetical protein